MWSQLSGEHYSYPRSELALGQQADEQVLHSILVVVIGRHVQTGPGLIHVSTHTVKAKQQVRGQLGFH